MKLWCNHEYSHMNVVKISSSNDSNLPDDYLLTSKCKKCGMVRKVYSEKFTTLSKVMWLITFSILAVNYLL